MEFINSHLLSLITFVPLLGALLVLALPGTREDIIRWSALVITCIPLLLSLLLFAGFDRSFAGMQFIERYAWIRDFNINVFMGVDGLSMPMALLCSLICPICVLASWNIERGVKGYFFLFLLLEAGMLGVFTALDFFLFFVFWEVMLLPMYFLIGIWGGPRREYAALKFFLYTLIGSVMMLLVIIYFYLASTPHTFDMIELARTNSLFDYRMLCWFGLFIGFAIKVPIFPFHTWLPDAHVEAPTAISVILAGVLLKMGAYGILRINYTMLPDITMRMAAFMAALGVINIIYGALCAMAQKDLKKLVAYSSISHMGYVILGMASFTDEGLNGAIFQMFNHGIVTAMLFLLVGVIYDRAHHRDIDSFGGIASVMPNYAFVTFLAFFAALGLPGLNSFISEALVFLGAFQKYRILTAIAASGVIITAAYCLWTLQRVFLGKLNEKYSLLPDLTVRETVSLVPLCIIVVVLGVYPHPVLNLMKQTVSLLNRIITGAGI
ncbi:MAG: oxidoreductase [Nitrospira bacterium HGW-Nitrospira-1]|nr:MAG: oxidoreductase [Nitrospira bacterium HGW-Nitrospira-1]